MHFNLEGDTFVDQIAGRREHFVPWHSTDVVEYLAQHPALPPERQATFRELAALILWLLNHLYRQHHEQLSYIYAPLDPDRDRLRPRSIRDTCTCACSRTCRSKMST